MADSVPSANAVYQSVRYKSIAQELAAAAQFEAMKKQGKDLLPQIDHHFDKGAERFLNKGVNERWRQALSADDIARYEDRAAREFSPALARWVAEGRLKAGDPRDAAG